MEEKDRRKAPRIKTELYVHIFKEQRFFEGKMLDISVWGAKIKCKDNLEDLYTLRVGFIFDEKEYTLDASIIEKLPNDMYRIAFSYGYVVDKLGIKYSIDKIFIPE